MGAWLSYSDDVQVLTGTQTPPFRKKLFPQTRGVVVVAVVVVVVVVVVGRGANEFGSAVRM